MTRELIYAVEDDAHIQQLIKYNLEANGYKVSVFETGEQLLEACDNEPPHMFILDIMLPGIDGLEVCRMLRQNPRTKKFRLLC